MSELKPLECPCCHRPPTIMSNRIGDFYAICYTNEPDEMACGMSTSDRRCETEHGAVERWNKFVTAALTKGARIGLGMAAKWHQEREAANKETAHTADHNGWNIEAADARAYARHHHGCAAAFRAIPDTDIMKEISRE